MPLTIDEVWQALDEVHDPEIPVVSLVEMGIVRNVELRDSRVVVTMTPTFAGCPALEMMKGCVQERLRALGVEQTEIKMALTPPWTSDWITESVRIKLKKFGLAPPPRHGGNVELFFLDPIECPYCGSTNTRVKNNFGPTLCRAILWCTNCQQPFEQFKPL